jgi:hypothetical protein
MNPNQKMQWKPTDSVFYDSKGREIKRLHYNEEDLKALDRKNFSILLMVTQRNMARTRMDTSTIL